MVKHSAVGEIHRASRLSIDLLKVVKIVESFY